MNNAPRAVKTPEQMIADRLAAQQEQADERRRKSDAEQAERQAALDEEVAELVSKIDVAAKKLVRRLTVTGWPHGDNFLHRTWSNPAPKGWWIFSTQPESVATDKLIAVRPIMNDKISYGMVYILSDGKVRAIDANSYKVFTGTESITTAFGYNRDGRQILEPLELLLQKIRELIKNPRKDPPEKPSRW